MEFGSEHPESLIETLDRIAVTLINNGQRSKDVYNYSLSEMLFIINDLVDRNNPESRSNRPMMTGKPAYDMLENMFGG